MQAAHTYQQARTRARWTPTVLLRRQERRIITQRWPDTETLTRLAAIRAELRSRTAAVDR